MSDIQTLPDPAAVAQVGAEQFVTLAQAANTERGQFNVALSGGSTPKAMFALLTTDAYSQRVAWDKVHVFWGDERSVPPDDPDSNYRMAREAFLSHVPLPEANIHRIESERPLEEAAQNYQQTLRQHFGGAGFPRFDLILLGMGGDGHTASLFPQTAALDETNALTVPNFVPQLNTWRVTLTVPVINQARQVTFLVVGAGKAERLHDVLRGTHDPQRLPSQLIAPTDGTLTWLLDQAAAALLT